MADDFVFLSDEANRLTALEQQLVETAYLQFMTEVTLEVRYFAFAVIRGIRMHALNRDATRLRKLADVAWPEVERRDALRSLVVVERSGGSSMLLTFLPLFGEGFASLSAAAVERCLLARGPVRATAELIIQAREFGCSHASNPDDVSRRVRDARKIVVAQGRAEGAEGLEHRLTMTMMWLREGLPFATSVAGAIVAARRADESRLAELWDAIIPVHVRQADARLLMERFAVDWLEAPQPEQLFWLLEMLAKVDPAFKRLPSRTVAEIMAGMTRRAGRGAQGPLRTLARLAVACGALGFARMESEPEARAVERATRQLKREAPGL